MPDFQKRAKYLKDIGRQKLIPSIKWPFRKSKQTPQNQPNDENKVELLDIATPVRRGAFPGRVMRERSNLKYLWPAANVRCCRQRSVSTPSHRSIRRDTHEWP
eukprot:1022253-Amphidinium_carterae.1